MWIDLEDPILFSVRFRHTPTHRGSLAELAKSLASYVSGSRSRYVGRGGTLCKIRVVESADAVHFHVRTTRISAYDRALRYMGAGQLWQDQHRCVGDDVLSVLRC